MSKILRFASAKYTAIEPLFTIISLEEKIFRHSAAANIFVSETLIYELERHFCYASSTRNLESRVLRPRDGTEHAASPSAVIRQWARRSEGRESRLVASPVAVAVATHGESRTVTQNARCN